MRSTWEVLGWLTPFSCFQSGGSRPHRSLWTQHGVCCTASIALLRGGASPCPQGTFMQPLSMWLRELIWQWWLCCNLTGSWGKLPPGGCSNSVAGPDSWCGPWKLGGGREMMRVALLQQGQKHLQKKQYEL